MLDRQAYLWYISVRMNVSTETPGHYEVLSLSPANAAEIALVHMRSFPNFFFDGAWFSLLDRLLPSAHST